MIRLEHMNDTNKKILQTFNKNEQLSSSDVLNRLDNLALITIKRGLSKLTELGFLDRIGAGRSTKYQLSRKGVLLKPFDLDQYLNIDQENRIDDRLFNHNLFDGGFVSALDEQMTRLSDSTEQFQQKSHSNQAVRKQELERFVIEMSWKSGRIEGNTYSLLDTEQLLKYGIKSDKNTEFETQMLLNQKAAFDFVWQTREQWKQPTVAYLERLHSLIVKNLGVEKNLRNSIIGITGTDYRPLENNFQIREALENLLEYAKTAPNPYEAALVITAGISYIQPFNDGNKRTARMTANAILLANNLAPVSYRNVDESKYKEALLIFYEQNSIVPFRDLFVEQYIYSATHYNIAE